MPLQCNLGVSRLQLGRPAKAIAPIEASLRVTGENLEALLALGSAAANAGFFERALDAFDRALAPRLHALRGEVLLELERQDDARRAFSKALALDSQYAPAQRELDQLDG